jgi:hypothetical protein
LRSLAERPPGGGRQAGRVLVQMRPGLTEPRGCWCVYSYLSIFPPLDGLVPRIRQCWAFPQLLTRRQLEVFLLRPLSTWSPENSPRARVAYRKQQRQQRHGLKRADTGGKDEAGRGGDHSSGEYSGVVDQAAVGISGNAQDMAAVISSGNSARAKREANRRKKEDAEKRKREDEGQRAQ